jgi:hypothetical protein
MSDPADDLFVKISGDTKEFLEGLDKAVMGMGTFGEVAEHIKGLIAGPAGFAVAAAFAAKVMGDLAESFAENQTAEVLYQTALSAANDQTKAFKDSANNAVESIMKMTGATDDAAKAMVQTLINTGRTAEEIDKMTVAAMGMANATGISADAALTQLNATFSGTSGRLTKLNPELKDLTTAQLTNGEAVEVLYQKYGKFAGALEDTADVSMKRYNVAVDEFKAALGAGVSDALQPFRDGLIDVLNAQTAGMNAHREYVAFLNGTAKPGMTDYGAVLKEAQAELANLSQNMGFMFWNTNVDYFAALDNQQKLVASLTNTMWMEQKRAEYSSDAAAKKLIESKNGTEANEILLKQLRIIDAEITAGLVTETEGLAQKTKMRQAAIDKITQEALAQGSLTSDMISNIKTQQSAMEGYAARSEEITSQQVQKEEDANAAMMAAISKKNDAQLSLMYDREAKIDASLSAVVDKSVAAEEEIVFANDEANENVLEHRRAMHIALSEMTETFVDEEAIASAATAKAWTAASDSIKVGVTGALSDTFLKSIDKMGEAFKEGAGSVYVFDQGLKSFLSGFMDSLPKLLMNAGLSALAAGPAGWPLGVALIVASGLVELSNASGFTDYAINRATTPAPAAPAAVNAEDVDWGETGAPAHAGRTYYADEGYASGTDFAPGGLSWVGEEGPELINVPTGSQVFSNSQSKKMIGDVHFHAPTEIDPIRASRLLTQTQRRLAFEAAS